MESRVLILALCKTSGQFDGTTVGEAQRRPARTIRIVSEQMRLAIRLMCGNTVLTNKVLFQEMAEDLQYQPMPPVKGATTNLALVLLSRIGRPETRHAPGASSRSHSSGHRKALT